MATIIERYDSRSGTVSPENPSAELIYVVSDTEDENEVIALVQATIPAFYRGLPFNSYTYTPKGGGVWEVTVQYTKREPRKTGESVFSFDTGGGTTHITQSLNTVASYGEDPDKIPDFHGAINVNNDRVEGTDIVIPQYHFRETHYLPTSFVTAAYKATLFRLTGTVNLYPFREFAPGELLFLGASGSKRGTEDWEITYSFAASPNATNLQVGNITGISKRGWEYMWVLYKDAEDEDAHTLVKKPVAVYIEQVYRYEDFSQLGI